MVHQVVLEISNSYVKAGLLETSSLPLKTFPSWGLKTGSKTKCIGSQETTSLLPENEQDLIFAIKNNEINNLDFLIELIEFSIVNELEISRESFDQVQLILVLPSNLIAVQLGARSKLLHRLQHQFNFPNGTFLGEISTMATLGSAHGTALVLNFDGFGVEVAAVNDFNLQTSAVEYYPHGTFAVVDLLSEKLVAQGHSMQNELALPASFVAALNQAPQQTIYNLLFVTAASMSSLDEVVFAVSDDVKVKLPLSLVEGVLEDVFDGDFINVIGSVLNRVESDRRSIMMNHIILAGSPLVRSPFIRAFIQKQLQMSPVMAASDYPADGQPTVLAFRTIPDYYPEVKERGAYDCVTWFGAGITGKYAFADPKSFVTAVGSKQVI